LKLRKGLTFHDGSPATSKDLQFTIERYRAKEAVRNNIRNAVVKNDIIDDLTVRVTLNKPLPYFPYYLSNTVPNQGSLMPKDYIEKNGMKYFLDHPIGVGPWKFESQVIGTSHTYTAVENHWRKTPGFKTLKVTLVPGLDTQRALVQSGELDVAYLSIEDAKNAQKLGLSTYDLFAPAVRVDFKGAYDDRAKGKPITDIKVREALTRAIDFKAVNESLFGGRAFPRVPPRALYGMDEVDPKWTDYIETKLQTYDPAKAKKLLADAGYSGGFSLDFFVANFGGIPYISDLSGAIQAFWAEVGVKANIVPLEIAEYNKLIIGPQDRAVGAAMFGNTGTLGAAPNNFEYLWGS
jgi:ABC-type transport system substrate-binding protein